MYRGRARLVHRAATGNRVGLGERFGVRGRVHVAGGDLHSRHDAEQWEGGTEVGLVLLAELGVEEVVQPVAHEVEADRGDE